MIPRRSAPEIMMSYVFIVFDDSRRELAGDVQKQLETTGIPTWLKDPTLDWQTGKNAALLKDAIGSAAAVLVIAARGANNVEHITRDVHSAYQLDKPIFMMRDADEIAATIPKLAALMPAQTDLRSPLPRPLTDADRPQPFNLMAHWRAILVAVVVTAITLLLVTRGVWLP